MLLTLLSGAPVSAYQPGHVESHHKHLEEELDIMRTTKMTYKNEALNLLLFFPTIIFDIQKNDFHYMMEQKKKGKFIFVQFLTEILILHLMLLSLFYINIRKAIVIYFIPTLLGKYMIVSLNILQHRGCDPTSKFNHSRDFTGKYLNYFFFQNGYHIEHHNSPGVHWSKLHKIHEKHRDKISPHLIHDNICLYIYSVLCST